MATGIFFLPSSVHRHGGRWALWTEEIPGPCQEKTKEGTVTTQKFKKNKTPSETATKKHSKTHNYKTREVNEWHILEIAKHIKQNEFGAVGILLAAREGHLCHGTSTKKVSWHFTAPSPLGQPLPLCFLFRTAAGRALILPGWASSGLGAGYLAWSSSCLEEEWMAAQEHIPG